MVLPSDDDLKLELQALSAHLYTCVEREGDLAPNRKEYDKLRDRRYSDSRSLLAVFGLPVNAWGWTRLVWAFGFLCPTLGETKTASNRRRREESKHAPYWREEEDYPMTGTITHKEEYYVTENGAVHKITRTYISLR